MGYDRGMAALNLEMTDHVPHTEYSAEFHWDLVRAVTGLEVSADSPPEARAQAAAALAEAWDYDLIWSITFSSGIFGDVCTSMGHAVYMERGEDFSDEIGSFFSSPEEVLAFDPWELLPEWDSATILDRYEENYRSLCQQFPDCVNMVGVYVTVVSGLIALFGWELLLTAMGTDPGAFGEMTNRYSSWIQQFFDVLAETTSPVVMVHDDIVWTSGAIFHPDWYREYVFPNMKRQLAPCVEAGKIILFTSDGDYTDFVDDIADCGASGFVIEPLTDMKYIADKYGQTHSFIGNADTRILLSGTKEQIRAEVQRCMDIGKDCPGFFMAVGNHIPPNTPVENALYYNECYETLGQR
jgi:uroporphyrinogen-III decarboxylase